MALSRLLFLELLLAFSCVLADDWSVLPSPVPAAPLAAQSADWDILDAPATLAPAALDWSILPAAATTATTKPSDGNPDKGRATDGRFCSADCTCGATCDCSPCFCCDGYAHLEAEAVKTKKGAIIYVGTRSEDANAARREAAARGLLFMATKSLSGRGIDGKPEKFPVGTHELKPVGNDLYFVPRERKIPIPDKRDGASVWGRRAAEECVGGS